VAVTDLPLATTFPRRKLLVLQICRTSGRQIQGLPNAASLIANPELEFPVSRTKQRTEAKSNSKKTRVLHAPWRIAILARVDSPWRMRVLRAPSRITILRSPLSFAVARPQLGLKRTGAEGSLVTRFLIVTPRLEFCAIKTNAILSF
jgi:hypothetical protein